MTFVGHWFVFSSPEVDLTVCVPRADAPDVMCVQILLLATQCHGEITKRQDLGSHSVRGQVFFTESESSTLQLTPARLPLSLDQSLFLTIRDI